MSKVQENEQDALHPNVNTDDIPFAIEVDGQECVNTTEGEEADSPQEEIIANEEEEENPVESFRAPQADAQGSQFSLRKFLFGDFLLANFLRRQIWFILFLMLLAIVYISNRYAAQQEIIEEERLRKELVEKKNYALTRYAELTMMSRQSGLEQRLYSFGDSLLKTSTEPPFVIQKQAK